jgi:hypothetical protein
MQLTLKDDLPFVRIGLSFAGNNMTELEYWPRTLPREYSALNVVAIDYAAFQQFAPGMDVGIDLAREYEMASQMRG